MSKRLFNTMLGLVLSVQAVLAHGEIVIDRTRIIYKASAPGVTVNLRNEADGPRLVQVWIDAGDPQVVPELSDVPFTVSPPILRLDAGQRRALRVMYHAPQGNAIAASQESVYWLNVLGIRPSVDTGNQLQFAFRTRIKLFLRPHALPGQAQHAVGTLQWRLADDGAVQVRNPSVFHVSLSSVLLTIDGVEYRSEDPPMLLPQSVARILLKGQAPRGQGTGAVRFTTLDDHGTTREHTAVVVRSKDLSL
ncbi:fimbrial biogenesis chaperone [Pseudomonas synxantha]|uniref:fimbrial biogenesis chaperone n=1 Tax=Pseudomonas synxantha TaxID=47883 RepID=UPI000F586DD8|nr:molecular chaperone [Pseudomonas synxantha]AZE78718.1 Chaperone protein fimC precursor [Pseudomonas synxantha]